MSTLQRAVLIRSYGGADAAQTAEIEKPTPGQGEVRIQVRAEGVNGIDWKVREGLVKNAFSLPLPMVLGAEMAGVVDAVGPGAFRFSVGDRVMGAMGGLGAFAVQFAKRAGAEVFANAGAADLDYVRSLIERNRSASGTGKVVADFSR